MYEKIKKWYNQGLWDKSKVHQAVEKNIIKPEQYEEITGEPYEA